jgi:hypothetical protein
MRVAATAESSQHDHREHRAGVMHALQKFQAATFLQHQVGQDNIDRGVLQYFQSLFGAGDRDGFHTTLFGDLGAGFPNGWFIVYDEYVHRGRLA